jgi:hypothetical protein
MLEGNEGTGCGGEVSEGMRSRRERGISEGNWGGYQSIMREQKRLCDRENMSVVHIFFFDTQTYEKKNEQYSFVI